jgi:hypothetical protein
MLICSLQVQQVSGYRGGRVSEGQLIEIKEETIWDSGKFGRRGGGGHVTEVVVDRGSAVLRTKIFCHPVFR